MSVCLSVSWSVSSISETAEMISLRFGTGFYKEIHCPKLILIPTKLLTLLCMKFKLNFTPYSENETSHITKCRRH